MDVDPSGRLVITVHLPGILRPHAGGAEMLTITAPVNTIAELVAALERTAPRVARQLHDPRFRFAVNDEPPIDRRAEQPLKPGDRVAIVAASGG